MSSITRTFARAFRSTPAAFESKNIFVGNLSWNARNEDVANIFSQYGTVNSCKVLLDRETGRSRGFGFVEMEEADAVVAIEKLNGFTFQGRELRVNEADSRPPRNEVRNDAPKY